MPSGKYYFIISGMNGLVLDVRGESHNPGTDVITWHRKDGTPDNQLWYTDIQSGTIRSKLSGMCLDIADGNTLVVNPFDADRDGQKWEFRSERVRNKKTDRVLDIAGATREAGSRVCAWEEHGNSNQHWKIDHIDARYFYIASKLHGKVLDVKKHDPEAGGKVIMSEREKEPADSQLWYENNHGIISNKMNGLVLDSSHKHKVRLQPFNEDNRDQLWMVCEDRICLCHDHDKVLDIKGADQDDGAKVLCYDWHGNDNQRWEIQYI